MTRSRLNLSGLALSGLALSGLALSGRAPTHRTGAAATTALTLVSALALGGCSSLDTFLSGDKIDYRSTSTAAKTSGLEVPPDLTQLTRDSRYQVQPGGAVSAVAYQGGTPAAAAGVASPTIAPVAATPVAVRAIGDLRIERLGNERWLRSSLAPEVLWPQLQAFWKERGFILVQDQPAAGVMETDWAENRGKIPMDVIRSTIGKVFDAAYSTGELDKFRTRIERAAGGGSEVYITHRGMIEVYRGERKDSTVWEPRLADPQLEAELLSRLMLKLGATDEAAKAVVVSAATGTATAGAATPAPARARLVGTGAASTLQIDDAFERAWRRVGVALDRSGFTVEDRDRAQGVYFVRYVDPAFAGKDEPNFLAKLFSFGKSADTSALARYRVTIKADGARSTVSVLNGAGGTETGEAATRIKALLLEDLK